MWYYPLNFEKENEMLDVDSMTIDEIKTKIFEIIGNGDVDVGEELWRSGNCLESDFLEYEEDLKAQVEPVLKQQLGFEWVGKADADVLADGQTVRTIFKVGSRYIKLLGWHSSYGDSEFDEGTWGFVTPVEKTITEWKRV
jgi:hypothetical protein